MTKTKTKTKTKKAKTKKGQLFSNDNPETTVHGYGFSDKAMAKKTLKDLEHRDPSYQFQVVNTLYNRAKHVLKKTNDSKKQKNIQSAIALFHSWLQDYKKNKPKDYTYLPLSIINDYEIIADFFDISRKARGLNKPTKSDKGFLTVYREVKGDKKKLRNYPVKKSIPDGNTWDKFRNNYIKRRLTMLKNADYGLEYKDGKYAGLPTKIHINLIMNGYSPMSLSKLKKNIKKYERIIKELKSSS